MSDYSVHSKADCGIRELLEYFGFNRHGTVTVVHRGGMLEFRQELLAVRV